MTEEAGSLWITGFWRRVGAFFIDLVFLGLIGIGLGLFLKEQFVQLGGWGRLVGFIIALIYFGFLNSRLFGGQTIGKKLLNIRVVASDNQPIGLLRSFGRFSVLGVPYFLNDAQLTDEALTSFWMYLVSLIVFGGLLSIVYLYVFNRITRQSLHDLVFGTYVVNASAEKTEIGTLWRPHLIVVAVILVASALVPPFASKLSQTAPFKDLWAAQTALAEHPATSYVGVSSGTNTKISTGAGRRTTTYLSAQVVLKKNSVADAELAKQLATILANAYPNSGQKDVVQVELSYGYDIGIASSWSSHTYAYRPADLVGED